MANELKKAADPGGWIASAIANILVFITAPWAALGASVIAITLAAFKWTRDLLFTPTVGVAAAIWLVLWWTYVGLRVLQSQKQRQPVIVEWDCAYCITIEGISIAYSKEQEDAALQFIIGFRNLGNGPIKIRIEELRVVMGDRTVPEPAKSEMVVPRLSVKGLKSGAFRKEAVTSHNQAALSLALAYGRHDEDYSRIYKLKMNILVKIPDNEFQLVGVANDIISETDDPL